MKDSDIFSGIGPKTVFKKLQSGVLDAKFKEEKVVKCIEHFMKKCDLTDIKTNDVITFNDSAITLVVKPLENKTNITKLIDWMVGKNFNKERIVGMLEKTETTGSSKPKKSVKSTKSKAVKARKSVEKD